MINYGALFAMCLAACVTTGLAEAQSTFNDNGAVVDKGSYLGGQTPSTSNTHHEFQCPSGKISVVYRQSENEQAELTDITFENEPLPAATFARIGVEFSRFFSVSDISIRCSSNGELFRLFVFGYQGSWDAPLGVSDNECRVNGGYTDDVFSISMIIHDADAPEISYGEPVCIGYSKQGAKNE